ncbi:MAG: DUF3857 domain-containing protein [Pseudomonadota bacterium]
MNRHPSSCIIAVITMVIALHAFTATAAEDPRLTPWLQALSREGQGPGGVALYHALGASLRRLPQALLRDALSTKKLRTRDPFAAAARDQLLANLEREGGDLAAARDRTARHGYVLRWEVVLPERLVGVVMVGDPASGWVNPADYARFSGVEPVVLEARLQASAPGNVLILLGGDGVAALRTGEEEIRPPLHDASLLDQVAFCAALPAGPTSLRLELHPDRAARTFAVRLARPDGSPIVNLHRVTGGPGACVAGPLDRWDPGLLALPQAGATAGLWLLTRVGRITRPTEALLDALRPSTWLEMELLSEVLSDQRQRWESVCARTPLCADGWPAEVIRAEVEFNRGQSYRPLLRLRDLDRRITADAAALEGGYLVRARLLRADLLHGLGLVRGALLVLGTPGENAAPDLRDAWVNLQISAGAREAAIEVLRSEHERRPGARAVGSLLATLLTDVGRLEEAVGVWKTLATLHPVDPDLPMEQAQALARLGRPEEALALIDALEPLVGANGGMWEQRGRILARAGRDTEATTAWQRALELEPQNSEIHALLRQIAPGRRMWSTLRRTLTWALARTGGDSNGQAVEGLADLLLVTIHSNGLFTLHRQQILRIVDPGADGELSLSAVYDPHTEDLITLTAAILRRSGEVLQAPDGDDLSLSQEEFNLHYDLRERVRYFPRLEAGDVVVWETRLDQFRGARGGVSLVRYLQEGYPKQLVEIAVSVPRNLELRHAVHLAGGEPAPEPERTTEEDGSLYRWRLEDLPALVPRPFQSPITERSAYLVLSTMHSWRQVAEWYGNLLEQQVTETPEMEVLVESLGDAPGGPVAAAARFMADQVRYVGLEFGVNAYVPYPTARVFERRYGDCKDKSLLMVTLLRRLGVEAHLVLVRTFPYGAVPDPPPSISLFDHAIVRIPEADLWFDPTARYLGTGGLPWQNQGAQVLVLDGDPALETIPVAPASENRSEVRIVLQDGDDGLRVSGVARFTGAQARTNYEAAQDPAEWEAQVERYLTGLVPGFHLLDAPWEIQDAASPALRMEVDGIVETDGSGSVSLLAGLRFQPRLAELAQRSEDLLLRFPFEEHVVLQTDSAKLSFLGPADATGAGPGCRWSVTATPGRIALEVSLQRRRISVDDYPRFRECLGALDTALAQVQARMEGGS